MRSRFLLGSNESIPEGNIYADRSSLVLGWLLKTGVEKETFSLREVAQETGVSIGLVQKVFKILHLNGLLQSKGNRTAKRFYLLNPETLLKSWLSRYSITKKCKLWTYNTAFADREELLEVIKKSDLASETALALHSAAEAYGTKNTNLTTLELYMLDPSIRKKLEHLLSLEPQERGYEVLLIEPYYKSFLKMKSNQQPCLSPVLLTFLDLYHFPLRGLEQAEFMAERIPELKRIYKKE